MARNAIVVGDRHSGGGHVLTGSPFTTIMGMSVARVHDMAVCPKHKGAFPIVTGDPTCIVDGRPIARHGDALACGCRLISSRQAMLFLENGGAPVVPAGSGRADSGDTPSVAASAASSKVAVCEACMRAGARGAVAFLSR